MRTAIGIPFPQAVPNKPVIDRANCIKFKNGKCGACQKLCPTGAVDFTQQDELITEKVGAIVVATGFQVLRKDQLPAYADGDHPDVVTGLAIRAARIGFRSDRRRDSPSLRRQGAADRRVRPVRRLARPGERPRVLQQNLLHVHRQTRHALPAQSPRRPGDRPVHGCAHAGQGLRRILSPRHRTGWRDLSAFARRPHLPRRRPVGRAGRRHPQRRRAHGHQGRHGCARPAPPFRRPTCGRWRRSWASVTTPMAG